MSSKKKDKNEWVQCTHCDRFYCRAIILKHQKTCSFDDEVSTEDSLNMSVVPDYKFGYIENKLLNGVLKLMDTSQITLPNGRNDIVLLHPNTIKFLNIQVSSHVMLQFSSKKTYCTLWPCSTLPIDSMSISQTKMVTLNCKEYDFIQLGECNSVIVNATEVVITPTSNESVSVFNDIKDYLLYELNETIVSSGEFLTCTYYNKEYKYEVMEVLGVFQESDQQVKYIENSFQDLQITGSSTPLKYKTGLEILYCITPSDTILTLFQYQDGGLLPTHGKRINYKDVGGLFSQKKDLNDILILPFQNPKLFADCCITSPKGIILYGPSGTGKTLLATTIKDLLPNVYFNVIDGPELTSKFVGETEQRLRDVFNDTKQSAPSVLIIDEFDTVCPVRNNSTVESEKRIVATMLKLMDNIPDDLQFIVIALTNNISGVDLSLRRPGRFEKEIEVTAPNKQERFDVITKLMAGKKHKLTNADLIEISEITHGFVPSDLAALCKEAGIIAVQNMIKDSDGISNVNTDEFSLNMNCFKHGLLKIRPSALKAFTVDIPKVYWKDVGGQERVKQKLKESIEWPLQHPDIFRRMGISPPKGLLMYGPPGCSKTLMAKALATESGLNFISIKGPELFNKYLGESEKAVRDVFEKARASAPSIVFFDEIDALGVKRSGGNSNGNVGDRVLAQLLTELDGVEGLQGVIVVAATNRPDVIDSALLRPGRIDRMIYVPLPDDATRREIFNIQFRSIPISHDVSIESLVCLSNRYSGAEICSLCREAAMIALREDFTSTVVKQKHFELIFKEIKPAVTDEMNTFYNNFVNKTTGNF